MSDSKTLNSSQKVFCSTEKVYDLIAGDYDEANHGVSPQVLLNLKRFSHQLPLGGSILDVGCGSGRDMHWFESAGYEVVGLDMSKGMLEIARPRVSGKLIHTNCLSLDAEITGFDGVWCSASLLHIPKVLFYKAVLMLLDRLNPFGLLFVSLKIGDKESIEEGACFRHARFFARYRIDELHELLSDLPNVELEVLESCGWATVWVRKTV